MIDLFNTLRADIGWTIVWQSSLALAAGLAAAALLMRRPARADSLLVASVVAALVAPVGTFMTYQLGWGLWAAETTHLSAAAEIAPANSVDRPPVAEFASPAREPASDIVAAMTPATSEPDLAELAIAVPASATETAQTRPALALAQAPTETTVAAPLSIGAWLSLVSRIFLGAWLLSSLIALSRLLLAAWAGKRLVECAIATTDAQIIRTLEAAARRLGVSAPVEARLSARVRCPVVWCWSRRPIVLLPAGSTSTVDESAWLGIFCHELAHWKRRDHVSSLVTQLLCCALPWHPLAWWAARKHEELSELACDEWVLAAGQSAESYATSLLDLVPQQGEIMALAVLRNRHGLVSRIRRILRIGQARPAAGRRWVLAVAAATVTLVTLLALAQQRRLVADETVAADPAPDNAAKSADTATVDDEHMQRIEGVVLDLDDKPVAGARIYWIGYRQETGGTLPHNDPRRQGLEQLAESVTDDTGHFQLKANFDPKSFGFPSIVVRHAGHGMGLSSYVAAKARKQFKVYLPDATPIEGQILNPNGMPVSGARIVPVHIQAQVRRRQKPDDEAKQKKEESNDDEWGNWGWLKLSDEECEADTLPAFWPQPVTTGADGRFTIPAGDNPGTALLQIRAPEYGPHGVTVTDEQGVAEWKASKQDREASSPSANKFTLVLEPRRTVEGVCTDAATGLPIAGAELVFESSRHAGFLWNQQKVRATTDAQGAYRITVPATGRTQHLLCYPPPGYVAPGGHTWFEREYNKLFADGRVYRHDVPLTPGRIVRGRVVEAESRAPVADAAVLYRARSGNLNLGQASYFFYEPVLTDADGQFQITALTGPGLLTVQARSDEFVSSTMPASIAKGNSDVTPHAFVTVDIAADGDVAPVDLEVRRGSEMIIGAVGPDSHPVADVAVAYHEVGAPATHRLHSARPNETPLRLPGCQPGTTYRVLLGTTKADLGTLVDVTFDPDTGPVKVTLAPTGSLRGRLVWPDGSPASDVNIFLHFHDNPTESAKITGELGGKLADRVMGQLAQNLPFYNNVMPSHKESKHITDANGEWEIKGLVPGVFLYLSVNYDFESGERHRPAGVIRAGEPLDMGQMVIKPR